MTFFFVVPSFVPPTLEQLTSEPDEVSLIVAQESKIHQEVRRVPKTAGRRKLRPWKNKVIAPSVLPPFS